MRCTNPTDKVMIHMKRTLVILIVALMVVAILIMVVGCGGSSSPQIKFDTRFLTVASSPNPPSKVLGNVTPSGTGGGNWVVFYDAAAGDIVAKLTAGPEGFRQPAQGKVIALAAKLDLAGNRFDIVTVETVGGVNKIYGYNGGAGVFVANAAGCKYIVVDGAKILATINGTKVDLERILPGAVVPMSG